MRLILFYSTVIENNDLSQIKLLNLEVVQKKKSNHNMLLLFITEALQLSCYKTLSLDDFQRISKN